MIYTVSLRGYLDSPEATFITLDAAFHDAAKRSRGGGVLFVWNWEGKDRRVRAFAADGAARWVKGPCKSCNGSSWICTVCKGVGYVE